MFGNQKPFGTATPFGASTSFGSSGFGTQTQTPATGGLFGGPSTTPATGGLFGGSNAFGTSSQSSAFGGTSTQSTGGGLFGATQPQSQNTSIFGTPATSNAFGAKTPAGFGTTSQGAGGMFGGGSTNTGSSLFGTSTSTASTGGGLFGGSSAFGSTGAAQSGSVIKFNPLPGQDTMMKGGVSQNISTRHQCITAMKEYEAKSMEELRVEDYLANRKGPQPGQPAAAGGLFGSTATTQSSGTSFNFAKPGGFNTAGSSLFGGASQPAGGGLFGTGGENKSLFGSTATTSAPSTGFGGFGTNTGGSSLFGTANTQQKSLFGAGTSTSQPGGLFGTTTTSAGTTGFGGAGGFGTQAGGGLFGANKPIGFGTAATTSSGFTFGTNTSQSGGLFGNKTATPSTGFSFGQNTGSTFGATQGTSLFGNKSTGFGTGNTLGSTGFGGLGTGLNTGGSSLFSGQQNKPGFGGTGVGFGATSTGFGGLGGGSLMGGATTGTAALGGSNNAAAEQAHIQQKLAMLTNSPYGDSPLFRNLQNTDEKKRDEILKPTNPAAQKAVLNSSSSQYKVSPRPITKIKPKPLQSLMTGKQQLFDGLEDEDASLANDTFIPRRSIKKLVIKNKSPSSISTPRSQSHVEDDLVAPSSLYPKLPEEPERSQQEESNRDDMEQMVIRGSKADVIKSLAGEISCDDQEGTKNINIKLETLFRNSSPLDDTISALNARNRVSTSTHSMHREETPDSSQVATEDEDLPVEPHPAGLVLTRSEYFTIPSLEELAEAVDEGGECWVENFVVGREGYGNVFFEGLTNVANMNLDEIVHFRRKEVTLYPDDSDKPPVGEGLNKKAQVTLDCVWPNDKTTQSPIKSPNKLKRMNYQDKIEQATIKIGAKFVEYRPDTGSWVFEVKHFSKYGLLDDSDEEEETDPAKLKLLKEQQMQQFNVQKQKIQKTDSPSSSHPQEKVSFFKEKMITSDQDRFLSMDQDRDVTLDRDLRGREAPGRQMDSGLGSVPLYDGAASAGMEEDQDMALDGYPDEAGAMAGEEEEMYGDYEQVPSSYQLAASLGHNAQNVQVMKASFFGYEEDIDSGESQRAPTIASLRARLSAISPGPLESSVLRRSVLSSTTLKSEPDSLQESHLSRSMKRESQAEVKSIISSTSQPLFRNIIPQMEDAPSMPAGMLQPMEPRKKLVGSRIRRHQVHFEKSVMHSRQRCMMDAGLMMGRSFRVGWGPNWTLAHCGKPVLQQLEEKPKKRFSVLPSTEQGRPQLDTTPFHVTVEQVDNGPQIQKEDPTLQEMAERHLQIQLESSESSYENGCPIFVPKPGVDALHKYAAQANLDCDDIEEHVDAETVHHTACVWDLAVALWGNLPDFHPDDVVDRNSYAYHMARREAISCWLTCAAGEKIKEEVQDTKYKSHGHIAAVLSYVTGRRIAEACQLAQENDDHRLALLLAQAAGSQMSRQMLVSQLYRWQEQQADQHIEPERLKLYALLAGLLVWRGSHTAVNVCQDLDWKRCLALHLWYLCSPSATVNDAMAAYEKAFKEDKTDSAYAAPPLPPYLEMDPAAPPQEEGDPYVIRDTCYHLLKLYCQRSHRLERTLAPSAGTPNPLDYRLSWHLGQVLQSLDYSHISEEHKAALCASYASQLETMGLWHWAAFVLLHITDCQRREHSIRELLQKHISATSDEQDTVVEDFLTQHLHIPKDWIHQAKAVKAHHREDHRSEAWHLLLAEQWNKSHNVLLRHLVADAIINEDYDYLREFLEKMAPHAAMVLDWDTGGKVFLDFLNLMQRIQQLKQGAPQVYELEQLQPEVMSLCGRVDRIQCFTAKDRLCQAELSKRVAVLLRTILTLQNPENDQIPTRLLAPYIAKLPMPEDYALQELRELTQGFIQELATES